MKVQFRGDKKLVGEAIRAKSDLQVRLLFGRFGDNVGGVTIRLSAAAGPPGHPDKRCQFSIGLKPRGVEVEHIDANLAVAFDRAADKAVRRVSRALTGGDTIGRLQREVFVQRLAEKLGVGLLDAPRVRAARRPKPRRIGSLLPK